MKVARVPAGRDFVRERQRRDRALAPTLRSLHPELGSLQIEFVFNDSSEFLPSPQVTVFHPPARAYFRFACPYGDCSGEFDLAALVAEAVPAGKPTSGGPLRCGGTRHGGAACTLSLDYSVTAHRE